MEVVDSVPILSNLSTSVGFIIPNKRRFSDTNNSSLTHCGDSLTALKPPRRSYDSCDGDFASVSRLRRTCDANSFAAVNFSVTASCEDIAATMLRFFSRRKAKGRAEQKVGAQSAARKPGAGALKNSKDFIQCSIILLDGSDLSLEIGVRFYLYWSFYKI